MKTTRFELRLSQETKERWAFAANSDDRSLSEFIHHACELYVQSMVESIAPVKMTTFVRTSPPIVPSQPVKDPKHHPRCSCVVCRG